MINKTDITKHNDANDAEQPTSLISTNPVVQKASQPLAVHAPSHHRAFGLSRFSFQTKATILSLVVTTIPPLVMGAIAYYFANQSTNQSTNQQITQTQALTASKLETQAVSLRDSLNRFMGERYADIQLLSSSPMFTNPKVITATTLPEKQAVLDDLLANHKAYNSIAIYDLEGRVILQSSGELLQKEKDHSYFSEVLRQNNVVISQPEITKNADAVNIYIAAPIKDVVTGKTTAVVRGRIPGKSLAELLNNYTANGSEYHLVDATGKIFLSPRANFVSKDAQAEYPILATKAVNPLTKVEKNQLVSYVPSLKLAGLPELKWQVLMTTNTVMRSVPDQQWLWTIPIGSALTAGIMGVIATWSARRTIQPMIQANVVLTKLNQGELNIRLKTHRQDELGCLNTNINQIAENLQNLAKQQGIDTQWTKLFTDITLKIRSHKQTEDIYQTAIKELHQGLKTDRVIIYQLNPQNWEGVVVAESVNIGWPKMLGLKIDEPDFRDRHLATYQSGKVRAITNIHEEPSLTSADDYIQLLEKFGIKSNLIAPIMTQNQLVGLLMAHHCESQRIWEQLEIDLFQQIAIQIGYALEQSQLLTEITAAREILSENSLTVKLKKETQILELLSSIESAAKGDLTVRADVTPGEIGTVADFFNSIVESLRGIVTQVKQTATQVSEAIGSNESAIHQLAESALLQVGEINHTLDAVDQMTNALQSVAQNAQQTAFIANHAAHTATQSGKAMDLTVQNILSLRETVGQTAKKVRRLGESSQQISRVVSLINQIAMQTNLLAINAGIEAARAGEEGQGFAVVAEEIGELAARSAAATQEIEEIVDNIQRETSEVVQAMEVGTIQVVEGTRILEDAKQNLSQILDVSRQIDSLVQSISTATTSQVQTSQTISTLMKDIAAVSQRTSDSSRQVSQSLQQTVEISHQLQTTVDTFKIN